MIVHKKYTRETSYKAEKEQNSKKKSETRKLRSIIRYYPCMKRFEHNIFELNHQNLSIFKASCILCSPNTPH